MRLGKQQNVAGLKFRGELGPAGGEFLGTAKIVHRSAIGILRGRREDAKQEEERNCAKSEHGVGQCSRSGDEYAIVSRAATHGGMVAGGTADPSAVLRAARDDKHKLYRLYGCHPERSRGICGLYASQ